MSDEQTATLKIGDKEYQFPLIQGTEGEVGIDISDLRKQTGAITVDRAYVNTGSCKSSITFLNGEEGILRYRGIPIEQLAEKSHFTETAYLLIYGELPTKDQLTAFETALTRHTLLHEDMKRFYDGFPRDAHPMAILSSAVGVLSTFYQHEHDSTEPADMENSIVRLLAKVPTIAAFAYKKSIGQPIIYPKNSLSYARNFLSMMFAVPSEEFEVHPTVEKALDLLLILHADHEQNCSTSTVRLVGSSRANLYASVSAGIMALWGKLHGGANEGVIKMLAEIDREGGDVRKFVDRVKDKQSGVRLMGFGHRVYKNFDPRANLIKKACDDLLNALGVNDAQLEIAKELEEAALKDEYFVSRKLYPNVDFYSGIMYRAIGIPTNMYTVLFAMGRLPGWISQWKEMIDANARIGRPRQIYVGKNERSYVSIDQR